MSNNSRTEVSRGVYCPVFACLCFCFFFLIHGLVVANIFRMHCTRIMDRVVSSRKYEALRSRWKYIFSRAHCFIISLGVCSTLLSFIRWEDLVSSVLILFSLLGDILFPIILSFASPYTFQFRFSMSNMYIRHRQFIAFTIFSFEPLKC